MPEPKRQPTSGMVALRLRYLNDVAERKRLKGIPADKKKES